jgi:hypothetical protein
VPAAPLAPTSSAPERAGRASCAATESRPGQSNLADIYLTVQAAYQRAAIELNAPSLTELQSDFGVLQARARHLLELPAPVILQFSRRRPG